MHVLAQQQHSVATAHTWLRVVVKQGCAEPPVVDGIDVSRVAAETDLAPVETKQAWLARWVCCHSCTVGGLCLEHGCEQLACVSHGWTVWCEALQRTVVPVADDAAGSVAVAADQGGAQELPAVHEKCLV